LALNCLEVGLKNVGEVSSPHFSGLGSDPLEQKSAECLKLLFMILDPLDLHHNVVDPLALWRRSSSWQRCGSRWR